MLVRDLLDQLSRLDPNLPVFVVCDNEDESEPPAQEFSLGEGGIAETPWEGRVATQVDAGELRGSPIRAALLIFTQD